MPRDNTSTSNAKDDLAVVVPAPVVLVVDFVGDNDDDNNIITINNAAAAEKTKKKEEEEDESSCKTSSILLTTQEEFRGDDDFDIAVADHHHHYSDEHYFEVIKTTSSDDRHHLVVLEDFAGDSNSRAADDIGAAAASIHCNDSNNSRTTAEPPPPQGGPNYCHSSEVQQRNGGSSSSTSGTAGASSSSLASNAGNIMTAAATEAHLDRCTSAGGAPPPTGWNDHRRHHHAIISMPRKSKPESSPSSSTDSSFITTSSSSVVEACVNIPEKRAESTTAATTTESASSSFAMILDIVSCDDDDGGVSGGEREPATSAIRRGDSDGSSSSSSGGACTTSSSSAPVIALSLLGIDSLLDDDENNNEDIIVPPSTTTTTTTTTTTFTSDANTGKIGRDYSNRIPPATESSAIVVDEDDDNRHHRRRNESVVISRGYASSRPPRDDDTTTTEAEYEVMMTTPSSQRQLVGELRRRRSLLRNNNSSKSPIPLSTDSSLDAGTSSGCHHQDMKRLSERLKEILSKRNQTTTMYGMDAVPDVPTVEGGSSSEPSQSSSSSARDLVRDRLLWESRLQAARLQQQRRRPCAVPREAKSSSSVLDNANDEVLNILSSIDGQTTTSESREIMQFADATVTFSDSERDATSPRHHHNQQQQRRQQQQDGNAKIRSHYRKSYSEVGIPSSFSTSCRSSRSKLSNKNRQSLAHGIGILQPNGIVYNDALLLRLARNARYGRLRGEVSNSAADVVPPHDDAGGMLSSSSSDEVGVRRRYNHVKIHVYDLMTNDSLVEMPYFNCNFPIGHCFKVVNDGCHMLGTGAYHVGVEVNGVEYAFGANNVIGMCGIFTCVPKESPGYEYRQTIDFGKIHTIKRTWIRFPKRSTSSAILPLKSNDYDDGDESSNLNDDDDGAITLSVDAPNSKKCVYSFCEIESFADGHAIIHSMAREYMGTDYDLLRKNCCTFALDVCIRLGVEKSDVPNWFHNAAQAGADAEDAISNMEKSVLGLMMDCRDGGRMDPSDLECYNHGFEVIMEEETTKTRSRSNRDRILTVVESPAMRAPRVRRPLNDFNETASWTY